MKFLFVFPVKLKSDLKEAMEIEKANFEKQTSKRLSRMERRLAEGMAKITARIGGVKTNPSLPHEWKYEFISDTKMILEINTPLDMIITMLQTMSSIGDIQKLNNLLKKLHITRDDANKKNEESRNRILKALKNYSDAEPELLITELRE